MQQCKVILVRVKDEQNRLSTHIFSISNKSHICLILDGKNSAVLKELQNLNKKNIKTMGSFQKRSAENKQKEEKIGLVLP